MTATADPGETAMSQPTMPDSPMDAVRRLYEENEAKTSNAMETLVAGHGYSELLAFSTSNVVALMRISGTIMDSLVRNLRVAGRTDIARLGTQQARTEDKLEMVLQAVEKVESRLASMEKEATKAVEAAQGSGGGGRARTEHVRATRSEETAS